MKNCWKCLACSYVTEDKHINGKDFRGRKFVLKIGREVNCSTKIIVYLLKCEKEYCKQYYIGITHQKLRESMYRHIGYVREKKLSRAT